MAMRFPTVVLLSILFCQSLSRETAIEERKPNMVVNILNKVLEDIVTELTTKNISIPLVNLEEFGRFEDVTIRVSKMTKWVDGVGSFGFHLQTNLSEILATGYYDIKNLDIPGLFPVFGKGDFSIAVEAVNLKMRVKATQNYEKDKFDFNMNIFDIQVLDSKVKFDNLMGDPNVSDFLNELIGNLIPDLVQAFLPQVSKILDLMLDFYGNGVVSCIKNQLNDLENCIKNLFGTVVDDIIHQLF